MTDYLIPTIGGPYRLTLTLVDTSFGDFTGDLP